MFRTSFTRSCERPLICNRKIKCKRFVERLNSIPSVSHEMSTATKFCRLLHSAASQKTLCSCLISSSVIDRLVWVSCSDIPGWRLMMCLVRDDWVLNDVSNFRDLFSFNSLHLSCHCSSNLWKRFSILSVSLWLIRFWSNIAKMRCWSPPGLKLCSRDFPSKSCNFTLGCVHDHRRCAYDARSPIFLLLVYPIVDGCSLILF